MTHLPSHFSHSLPMAIPGCFRHLGDFAHYFVVVHNNITARGNSSIPSFAPFTYFDSFSFSYSASTSSTVVAEGRRLSVGCLCIAGIVYQIEGYFRTDSNGLIIFSMRHK
jgi:hypothetical protein